MKIEITSELLSKREHEVLFSITRTFKSYKQASQYLLESHNDYALNEATYVRLTMKEIEE